MQLIFSSWKFESEHHIYNIYYSKSLSHMDINKIDTKIIFKFLRTQDTEDDHDMHGISETRTFIG